MLQSSSHETAKNVGNVLMQRGVGDTYAQDPGIEPFAAEPMLSRTPAVAISLANSHGSRRPGSRNSPDWDNDWKHDNDNWSHWDSATGVRVSVLACLLAGAAAAAL